MGWLTCKRRYRDLRRTGEGCDNIAASEFLLNDTQIEADGDRVKDDPKLEG